MGNWLVWLVRGRALELAIAVSLGYAAAKLADNVASIPALVLAQHVSDEEGVLGMLNLFSGGLYLLNFKLGSTVIFYGEVLASAIGLGLVVLVGLMVVRMRNREFGVCPFCASRIPYKSSHCAYCGSGVAPSEP